MPAVRTSVARALIPVRAASVNVDAVPIRMRLRTRSGRARTVACASMPPKEMPTRWTGRSLTDSNQRRNNRHSFFKCPVAGLSRRAAMPGQVECHNIVGSPQRFNLPVPIRQVVSNRMEQDDRFRVLRACAYPIQASSAGTRCISIAHRIQMRFLRDRFRPLRSG